MTPSRKEVPDDPPIYGADSLAVPERLPGLYCNSEPSKYENVSFSEAAAHAPDGLERLITPSDELG